MPQLSLSTNVPVDAVVAADIIRDCSKALARIIGKPESVTPPFLISRPFSARTPSVRRNAFASCAYTNLCCLSPRRST
jgi:hypothetical protein